MSKKKKRSKHAIKIGALGPKPYWLRMSIDERAITRQYIKEGLQGYIREDGTAIPGARRIYKGLEASKGYDLRHIERWSKQRLDYARRQVQALNTLTARPFSVVIPRTKKQRKEAQSFTGQNLPNQKEMIVPIQIQGRDIARFQNGKLSVERKFPSGSKTIHTRYLFADYMRPDENLRERLKDSDLSVGVLDQPSTFREMQAITERMLLDMPLNVYGQPAYYTLLTVQYGPVGRSATKEKIMDLLVHYFTRYDPGGTAYKNHEEFVEQVIGFQMVGTFAQMAKYQIEREQRALARKKKNKLRFSKRARTTGRV